MGAWGFEHAILCLLVFYGIIRKLSEIRTYSISNMIYKHVTIPHQHIAK